MSESMENLEVELNGANGLNDSACHQTPIGENFLGQKTIKLLETEQQLKVIEDLDVTLCKTVDELKTGCEDSKLIRNNLKKEIRKAADLVIQIKKIPKDTVKYMVPFHGNSSGDGTSSRENSLQPGEDDAVRFTRGFMQSSKLIIMKQSRPVGVKQPHLLIALSDEGQVGSFGNLIQRDTILYFTKIFQFQHFIGQNGLSLEVRKSGAGLLREFAIYFNKC